MQLVLDKSNHQVHKHNMNIQLLHHNPRCEAHLSVRYVRVRLLPDSLLRPSPPLSSSDTRPSGSDYALIKTAADQISVCAVSVYCQKLLKHSHMYNDKSMWEEESTT